MAEFCKNCGTGLNGKFCSNCGQKANLERINGHYIKHEIEHLLHFEKGIFYTIKELLIRPGKSIREFLVDNRSKLVKPIFFIIVTSLIYTLVDHYFHIEEQYAHFNETKATTTDIIMKWIQGHYGYANIMMAVFITFFVKLFFRKYNYNFYEILVLLCFVMGFGMLILATFSLLQGAIHVDLILVSNVLFMIYATIAIAVFFDKTKPLNYVKSFSAYILGMVIFFASAMALGTIIDSL